MEKKDGIKLELVLESVRECLQSSIQWKCCDMKDRLFLFLSYSST